MIYAMRGPRMEALSAPRAKGCGRVIETVTPGPPQIRIGIPHCRTLPPGARATSGPLHARPHPAVGLIPQPRRRAGTVTVAILSRTLPSRCTTHGHRERSHTGFRPRRIPNICEPVEARVAASSLRGPIMRIVSGKTCARPSMASLSHTRLGHALSRKRSEHAIR